MLRRAGVVVAGSLAVLVAGAVPALAVGQDGWGYTDCSQFPQPGCELGAGSGGEDSFVGGGDAAPLPGPGGAGGRAGGGDTEPRGDRIIGGDDELADCSYERTDFQPPAEEVQGISFLAPRGGGTSTVRPAAFGPRGGPVVAQPVAVPEPGEPGAWYIYRCTGPGTRDALYRPPVWIPDAAQPAGGQGPSAEELAEQARNQLRLPAPLIKANPVGDQLVSLPTWLWLDPAGWGEVSATASVPGVSVRAVARPATVTWSMGDGGSVTCTGPGSPFPAGFDPASTSPDCGYTYQSSSAGQLGDAFAVTAAVRWTVTWSGGGQAGTFADLTTTSTATFRVAETHALTTTGGG